MHRICDEKKREVIREYADGKTTVNEICDKHGIARRTVYAWAEKAGIKRKKHSRIDRKAIYMTREEMETILLLMLIGSESLKGEYLTASRSLEKRLLDATDAMEESDRAIN